MKNRFTTLDIAYMVHELQKPLIGLRVDQIYDVDKKTYLIRLTKTGVKKMLLIESGSRFHTTEFDWPKSPAPSGFSMKLRKHLNNKRLEKLEQLGSDRVIHFQFGVDTAAYHLFLEIYDKGNIILTDHTFTILNLVRPRNIGEERLAAHAVYNLNNAKQNFFPEISEIENYLKETKWEPKSTLRDAFLSNVEFGPTLFTYVLKEVGLNPQQKLVDLLATDELVESTFKKLHQAFENGKRILTRVEDCKGLILLSKPKIHQGESLLSESDKDLSTFYDQFQPFFVSTLYDSNLVKEFDSFDRAVDEFFSKVESQKLDMKQLNFEREAIKKLEKVKIDQTKRLQELQMGQEKDKEKAELITMNQVQVDAVIAAIRKLVANQISWDTIDEQIKEARSVGDVLANMIKSLNLKQSRMTLELRNPYEPNDDAIDVEVDLNLSAYANATKYFDSKKASAKKEERTLESQGRALKSTEKKTLATLKEAATIHSIKKARKVLWFEKFRWFISSENYLVLGGRDAQQNELLVKKYLRPRDVYLHADAHGAPTLVIKNDNPEEDIPPKTLNEASVFAVCCSGSWETKIVTSSWFVWGSQVSKSAPTGEYLPTGSFMIRGKKNYLPPCQLVLGFGFLFRLTESSLNSHANERSRKTATDDKTDQDVEEEISASDGEFPDTHVDVDVIGEKMRTRLSSTRSGNSESTVDGGEDYFITTSTTVSIPSAQKLKNKQKKFEKNKGANTQIKGEKLQCTQQPDLNEKAKRGQHGRQKKLKGKYKYQDEEERQLRMKLLKKGVDLNESGDNCDLTRSETNASTTFSTTTTGIDVMEEQIEDVSLGDEDTQPNDLESEDNVQEPHSLNDNEEVENEDNKDDVHETELDILKSLTGVPLEADELLYAVPVVAPYSTMQSYKYKIKIIPGSTKRGKAAKSALEYFLRDKEITPREKDLIKAVKDQDLARNFPGKVKLSNVVRDKK